MTTIEEKIFNAKFPNEEFNADNFNDWVNENSFDAYWQCLQIAEALLKENKMLERNCTRAQDIAEDLLNKRA